MTIRAVIFDRDGVLTSFDFAPLEALLGRIPRPRAFEELWDRWHAYYTTTDLPTSAAAEHAYILRFWDSVCDVWSLDADTRRELLAFDYRRMIRAFPDARDALRAAHEHGLRVGVLSNFPLVSLEESLVATGLRDLVDVARAATVLGKPKPHPDAYLEMIELLGAAPAECLLVDDEEPCVAGARAVGIDAYLLDRRAAFPSAPKVLPDLAAFARLFGP